MAAKPMTVRALFDLYMTKVHTEEIKKEMMRYGLTNDVHESQAKQVEALKDLMRTNAEDEIHLTKDKTLTVIGSRPSTDEHKASGSGGAAPESVPFSVEALQEILEPKSFMLDQNKVRDVLAAYMKEIPKEQRTYRHGEVKIFKYHGVRNSVTGLISAGTKVLDALLYMTSVDERKNDFIFNVKEIKPDSLNKDEINTRIDIGQSAIKCAFPMVYNSGSLPSPTTETRTLSQFIREGVFKDSGLTHNTFCSYLSVADPALFPAYSFMTIPLDDLAPDVASRCKLMVAGNRAIRYAALVAPCEKRRESEPLSERHSDLEANIRLNDTLRKAREITNYLCVLAGDFEAQKRLHPLTPGRQVRKNFTLKLTHAIIYQLSDAGRIQMRKMVVDGKILSFKKDQWFFGSDDSVSGTSFPVLTNPDASFEDVSVEGIKSAYGKL